MNSSEINWTFSNNITKEHAKSMTKLLWLLNCLQCVDAVFTVVLMRMKSIILWMSFYLHWSLLKLDFCISIVYSVLLKSTHEYFCEVLRTYLSTFIKWVLSTYSSTFQAISTQYLLKYWSSVLAPCLLLPYSPLTYSSHPNPPSHSHPSLSTLTQPYPTDPLPNSLAYHPQNPTHSSSYPYYHHPILHTPLLIKSRPYHTPTYATFHSNTHNRNKMGRRL